MDTGGRSEQTHLVSARKRPTVCAFNIFRIKQMGDDTQLITPLKRCLTSLELMLLGIGATLGMASFVLTGNVMKNIAGSGTFISFLLAGAVALLSAMCFAEFGAQLPKAGSSYTYTYVVAGELWAFVAGWNIILEYLLGIASIGVAFSGSLDHIANHTISAWANDTLAKLNPSSVTSDHPDLVAFFIVLIAGAFICIGVTPSVVSTCILTVINMCFAALTVVLSFYFADYRNFKEDHTGGVFPYGADGVLAGAATCFYAYYGLDSITVASEEALTPSKSVPFAIFSSITVSTVLYVMMSLALSFLIPYYGIDTQAAFSAAFASKGIHWAGYLVSAASLVSISASLLVTSYTLPRVVYAMASDGLFFEIFSYVHTKRQVPIFAVAACAVVASLLAMFLNIDFLTQFLSIGILISYTIVAVSIILYRYSSQDIFIHKDDDYTEKNENVGHLKPRFKHWPIVRNCQPGIAVSVAVFCLLIFVTGFWFLIRYAENNLTRGDWWAWILLVLLLLCCVTSVLTMYLFESKQMDISTFKVPFVPLTPCLSIVCNIFLMTKLSSANWLRFIVWMAVGILIYFVYGISHSREGRRDRLDFLELSTSDGASDAGSDVIGSPSIRYQQPIEDEQRYDATHGLTRRDKTATE